MNKLKFLLASMIGIVMLSSFTAPKAKKEKIEEPVRVYLYGVSLNFNDSLVYMTDVQYFDSVKISKDGSLQNYANYSQQMKIFLESTLGESNQTCAVIYSDNKKKLEKRYVKMRKKFQADKEKVLMKLGSAFSFLKEQ